MSRLQFIVNEAMFHSERAQNEDPKISQTRYKLKSLGKQILTFLLSRAAFLCDTASQMIVNKLKLNTVWHNYTFNILCHYHHDKLLQDNQCVLYVCYRANKEI